MIHNLLNIVISPRKGWESLRNAEISVFRVLFQVVIPILLVCGFMYSFPMLVKQNAKGQQILAIFLTVILSGATSIIVTASLLNKLSKPFKGVAVYSKNFLVASISFSVFLFIWILPSLMPTLIIPFRVLSIYSLILFYRGADIVLGIRFEKLTGFTMLAALLFALVITISTIVFSAFFQLPILF